MLRLLVTLEGEVVRDLKPIIGYVHTGIEKTAEQKAYWKVIPVIERMDYLSYYFNAMAFCGAVETLLECEVPKRAQYLRVIHLELNRIMSHLVWLGTSALDLGAISMFWYCFRERETILDLFEFSSGQRMHTRYFQVGGVIEDIPRGFEAKLREFIDDDAAAAPTSTRTCCAATRSCSSACAASARSTRRRCSRSASPARCCAPSGNPWDLRKAAPYTPTSDFDFKIPVGTDRRQLRPLRGAPGGDLRVGEDHRAGARRAARGPAHHRRPQDRAAAAPRARDLDGGADPPLQARHRGLPRAAGRGLLPDRVAARRARLLRALGRLVQARARAHARPELRQPPGDWRRWSRGAYIADLIATLAMLDPILGGIDR